MCPNAEKRRLTSRYSLKSKFISVYQRCYPRQSASMEKGVRRANGFTLIELMVSISIFLTSIIVVTSVFLLSFSTQRRAFAERRVVDALRSGLEVMAREVRTGIGFANCPFGCSSLAFKNDEDKNVTYALSSGCVTRSVDALSGCITPSAVTVENLNFIVSGAGAGDRLQPRITVSMRVRSRLGREETVFNLATSVSQRELDI